MSSRNKYIYTPPHLDYPTRLPLIPLIPLPPSSPRPKWHEGEFSSYPSTALMGTHLSRSPQDFHPHLAHHAQDALDHPHHAEHCLPFQPGETFGDAGWRRFEPHVQEHDCLVQDQDLQFRHVNVIVLTKDIVQPSRGNDHDVRSHRSKDPQIIDGHSLPAETTATTKMTTTTISSRPSIINPSLFSSSQRNWNRNKNRDRIAGTGGTTPTPLVVLILTPLSAFLFFLLQVFFFFLSAATGRVVLHGRTAP